MTTILTISLRGGGAERQISTLSKLLPLKKIVLLEQGIDYDIKNTEIQSLSQHNENTFILKKILG
ncbi:hypothetical protein HN928_03605, partial [bacterium]|nr:hypothetical protein [bacterium]